ncbi:MAG TPA: UDP-N-acetylmuramate dehydrogenase [Vicinamibacterales bacterium]|nr:UDP-N-acetylmuramate dehydrogenase [Vicinamibacterales bacterium]
MNAHSAAVDRELTALFGERVRQGAPLAPLTTFKVGGPADWLIDARSEDELRAALAIAAGAGQSVTMLGGGSNVLVSDAGVRGLVIRLRPMDISQPAPDRVRADAGLTINGLVRWTIGRGIAGLEAWAGTPGTVGGAIHGNAHFGGRNIGDLVAAVRVISPQGEARTVPAGEMEFGYDTSRLRRTRDILLWAEFLAGAGDPGALRAVARASLAHRKKTQPLDTPSAGCIFQNPDPARDRVPDGIPPSAGALVDRAGLKGSRLGAAKVSDTHANFIVNEGGATAADIRALIDRCKTAVRERFGVALREEIVYLGEC